MREQAFPVIRALNPQDEEFYALVGPFLSNRTIVQEIGSPIWDDAGKCWLVAIEGGEVIGLCAYVLKRGYAWFCSDYVSPDHRGRGIYARLFAERLRQNSSMLIKATVTDASLSTYLRHGFAAIGHRGRFTLVQRPAASA